MGSFAWLTRRISPQPIAVHFGSDVIRFMQIKGFAEHSIHDAIEVANNDHVGISDALLSFRGKRCVACLSPKDALVQHIRTEINDESHLLKKLVRHDERWEHAEIRSVCVKTTGSGLDARQELLCVGINRTLAQGVVRKLETAGAQVIAVTVPLYASIRAFDKLYRRDGDDKITSMLIDMDELVSMVMISHGSNCVFAHRVESCTSEVRETWGAEIETEPALLPISTLTHAETERRNETNPRGLCGVQGNASGGEKKFVGELVRCLRHHDTLFPERTIDRVIFTGSGAIDTERCASIASELGITSFIADPSAWIKGASEIASGPSWTTAAGLCLRYSERAA